MACQEAQQEEKEVLLSIYDGDECFKQIMDNIFQYRIGPEGHFKSFLLEITWGENYPDEVPEINLETFFNNHLQASVRCSVAERIRAEAEQWLGSAVTYTLFEWAKENADDLMSEQTETPVQAKNDRSNTCTSEAATSSKSKEKKEILTKAQKRKLANRTDYKGEMPRGWDWVDVVKHLSKTGSSKPQDSHGKDS